MENKSHARVWLAVIIALIAVVLIILTVPKQQFKPQGLILPAKQTRPVSMPSQIQFYAYKLPAGAQVLGHINIEMHFQTTSSIPEKQIAAYARMLASQVGANGVVVTFFRHTPAGARSPTHIYLFYGTAVYAPIELQS